MIWWKINFFFFLSFLDEIQKGRLLPFLTTLFLILLMSSLPLLSSLFINGFLYASSALLALGALLTWVFCFCNYTTATEWQNIFLTGCKIRSFIYYIFRWKRGVFINYWKSSACQVPISLRNGCFICLGAFISIFISCFDAISLK